ncbi:MAG: 2-C-methyl-D-erythritol 2,4-cyclodiphosphate synthase [Muribaculaceae bacterium]|nr:2-C-methyl-D-erythritol 2,4-cyclodiphosphate synthase [Muribaculaceae bacterium]
MIRIGQGYDVHRLTEGRELWLCGVKVAHSLGLDGHSDADVAIHALCDALLGALALGDIGKHFPDTDPAYKGIDSRKLLAHVCGLVASHGYRLGNADVTIMAQRPRLAPYIEEMRRSLAEVTGADTSRISVKATTTERLGFEGREEGISASAVVLLCSTT